MVTVLFLTRVGIPGAFSSICGFVDHGRLLPAAPIPTGAATGGLLKEKLWLQWWSDGLRFWMTTRLSALHLRVRTQAPLVMAHARAPSLQESQKEVSLAALVSAVLWFDECHHLAASVGCRGGRSGRCPGLQRWHCLVRLRHVFRSWYPGCWLRLGCRLLSRGKILGEPESLVRMQFTAASALERF